MKRVPLEAIQRVLAAAPEVRWAYLFGSAARDDGWWHDLDVGVVTAPRLGLLDLGRLAGDLESAAGAPVDLVDLAAAPAVFVYQALRDGTRVLVDRDREARLDWESERISQALDFLPDYRAALAAWRRRIRGEARP
jgi:predicted nucleotidyltransferase